MQIRSPNVSVAQRMTSSADGVLELLGCLLGEAAHALWVLHVSFVAVVGRAPEYGHPLVFD